MLHFVLWQVNYVKMLSVSFRSIQTTLNRGFSIRNLTKTMPKALDPLQEAALQEKCFLVNENDKVIGQATKEICHRVQSDGTIPLHRAFSVFLFNKSGDLLLQKRSSQKITYPDFYTNSCCSHPILNFPAEGDETDAVGIKRAAQRRLNYELGISTDEIPLNLFQYITRIHYKDAGNGKWGEHEIDYVLFLKADVSIKPNPNEISATCYVSRETLDNFISNLNGPLTPWFQLILKHRLKLWWDNLDNIEHFQDSKSILKLY